MGDTEFRGVKVDLDFVKTDGTHGEGCPLSMMGEGVVAFVVKERAESADSPKSIALEGGFWGHITTFELACIIEKMMDVAGAVKFARAMEAALNLHIREAGERTHGL